MPRTLADWLAGLRLAARLASRIRRRPVPPPMQLPIPHPRPRPDDNWRPEMTLFFLDGYKTYIIAAAMLLAGFSQLLGVELPSFEGHAAGQLIMEGLAIIFLRRGIKATG